MCDTMSGVEQCELTSRCGHGGSNNGRRWANNGGAARGNNRRSNNGRHRGGRSLDLTVANLGDGLDALGDGSGDSGEEGE
jgi:hypothetical protein